MQFLKAPCNWDLGATSQPLCVLGNALSTAAWPDELKKPEAASSISSTLGATARQTSQQGNEHDSFMILRKSWIDAAVRCFSCFKELVGRFDVLSEVTSMAWPLPACAGLLKSLGGQALGGIHPANFLARYHLSKPKNGLVGGSRYIFATPNGFICRILDVESWSFRTKKLALNMCTARPKNVRKEGHHMAT
eukprot:g29809.t1